MQRAALHLVPQARCVARVAVRRTDIIGVIFTSEMSRIGKRCFGVVSDLFSREEQIWQDDNTFSLRVIDSGALGDFSALITAALHAAV